MICELHSSGINNALNLVWNDKFKVLGSELVTNEQPVFDLDDAHQVVFVDLLADGGVVLFVLFLLLLLLELFHWSVISVLVLDL